MAIGNQPQPLKQPVPVPASGAPAMRPVPIDPSTAPSKRPVPVDSSGAVVGEPLEPATGALAAFLRYCLFQEEDVLRINRWFKEKASWYLVSGLLHAILLMVFVLIPLSLRREEEPPMIELITNPETEQPPLGKFEVGAPSLDPTELNTDTLLELDPPAQTAQYFDDQEQFEEGGSSNKIAENEPLLGGMGIQVRGAGVNNGAEGGVGGGLEEGGGMGNGARGEGFGGRGQGMREEMIGKYGGTKASERAVAAGLNWLYRHQSDGGNWSLSDYTHRCKGSACTGTGIMGADAAATALALLPFLAAGQTHKSKGPYQKTIQAGVSWLLKHQINDGALNAGSEQKMYTHGIATIALCEAYGLSGDKTVGAAAQKAVHFIENAQNKTTGGWRYQPGDEGDTSVLGWQVMALKSAQMAKLEVDPTAFEGAKKFLKTVARGRNNGLYAYQGFQTATPTMTAVGLLSAQYLGSHRDDKDMREGRAYLMAHLPDNMFLRNTYYWYYATQVMHNFVGTEWDTWNRHTRRILIESQVRGGCSEGSWDPERPSQDAWGAQGGRLVTTSFAVLSLEVYYRYLPLYQVEPSSAKPPKPARGQQADAR